MGFENGLKEGLFTQKSKYNLRKKEMMLQNLVLQHLLCLHSEASSFELAKYYDTILQSQYTLFHLSEEVPLS